MNAAPEDRQPRAASLLFAWVAANRFMPLMPFFTLCLEELYGWGTEEVIQLFAIYTATRFCSEVPTGLVADRTGPRGAVVAGSASSLLGLSLFLSGTFTWVAVGEVLIALGESLVSGAADMLLFAYCGSPCDGVDKARGVYESALSRYMGFAWASVAVSALAGQGLYMVHTRGPILGSIAGAAIAMVLALRLPRTPNGIRRKGVLGLWHALGSLLGSRSVLAWFLLGACFSALVVTAFQLVQPLLSARGLAGPSNGLVYFVMTCFAVLGTRLQPTLSAWRGATTWGIPISLTLLCLVFLGLGFAENLLVFVVAFAGFRVLWGWSGTVFVGSLNQSLPSDEVRATVLSLSAMTSSLLSWSYLLLCAELPLERAFLILGLIALALATVVALLWSQHLP